MPAARRIGSESSKTRASLLDAAQRVMLEDGYATVTYRSLADRAGVTAGLVQYYFPTLDDMFLALLQRRTEQSHARLLAELDARPDEPLRIVWEFSTDETSASLLTEFMALANHRKAIRAAILETTVRTRQAQLEALHSRWDSYHEESGGLPPEGLLFLLHMIPKMMQLEESFGLATGHDDVLKFVKERLEAVEPRRSAPKLRAVAAKKEGARSRRRVQRRS
jgi:TetR/AcrR family transcriptional regulator, transcriptional repressor for nem operon